MVAVIPVISKVLFCPKRFLSSRNYLKRWAVILFSEQKKHVRIQVVNWVKLIVFLPGMRNIMTAMIGKTGPQDNRFLHRYSYMEVSSGKRRLKIL